MADRGQMVQRQQVLADFGEFALRNENLDEVLTEACRLVGAALGTEFAKVLEIQDDGRSALLRAGIGWKPDLIGHLRLHMGERSSEEYALHKGKPIVTPNIFEEKRFDFPDFMKQAGVIACVNVPIFLPGGKAYGLLQVDALEPRDFGEEDIQFLRTYGTVLGPVIDRLFKVHALQAALDVNRDLMQELQHRIKNHIGVITSLVRVRAKAASADETREELADVAERVEALRLVHEQLYAANAVERLRLRPYITQLTENLCRMHEGHSGKVRLEIDVVDLDVTSDTAVPLGLILNEFVCNSLKYAFDGRGGVISIRIEGLEYGVFRTCFSDDGKGLPSTRQTAKPGFGTGIRLTEALARQIGAKPQWSSEGGTSLRLEFTPR